MYTWLEELPGVGTYANICHFICKISSLRSHLGHPIPPMQVSTDRRHTHADDELLTSSLHALCKQYRVANCETWSLQPGRNTRLDGAPQPARWRPTRHPSKHGRHQHATFELLTDQIGPGGGPDAPLERAWAKWGGLRFIVPPDFCPITTFVPRLGIRRAVQQLGAPSIFKTLAARTRPHGGLRRARLAHDTGRRARAKTAPRGAGSTRRHWSLCMRVEWAVTSRC